MYPGAKLDQFREVFLAFLTVVFFLVGIVLDLRRAFPQRWGRIFRTGLSADDPFGFMRVIVVSCRVIMAHDWGEKAAGSRNCFRSLLQIVQDPKLLSFESMVSTS
jgi:hypothetical protein